MNQPSSPPATVSNSQVLFLGDSRVDGSFGRALAEVPERFPDVECFVINLECAVAKADAPRLPKSHPLVASYEEFAEVLAAFRGRKVVFNLANNHSEDAGRVAKEEFVRWCLAQGVALVDQDRPAAVTLGSGRRLGIYAGWDTGCDRASGPVEDWVLPTSGELKARHESAVFLAHWGEEYVFYRSPRQMQCAHALWRAGFELVVGCHPHVVQGAESKGRHRAFYSLGNGTMHMDFMLAGSRVGAALLCEWGPDGQSRTTLVPCVAQNSGQLRWLDQAETLAFEALIQELSSHPTSPWWWRQQAARVFFRNHMASWRIRVREHGLPELARMFKAFTMPSYLLKGAAWLMSGGRTNSNDVVAERMDRLAGAVGAPAERHSLVVCCCALLEMGLLG